MWENRPVLKRFLLSDTKWQKKHGSGATIRKKSAGSGDRMEADMTETIYEKKTKEVPGRQLPNNRRQIGQPGLGSPEVFIEDYAFSYARGLSEREYTGCVVGVLVGEYVDGRQKDKILVKGVLEARDVMCHDTVCFTEDNWAGIYRDIRDYFPDHQIVGWFLGGPGFLLEDEERQKKIQEDNFGGGDKIFLKMDSAEKEQRIYFYTEGEMKQLPGYYIYYERNTEMQTYMTDAKGITELKEKVRLPEREDQRIQPEVALQKPVEVQMRSSGSFYRLFYATGSVLTCMAILVIAGLAMQIQERNELKELLNRQEKLVSSLQQVYVVEEGETIESICGKFYGNTEQEEAIRLLNSLEEGEEPVPGQKIFLP